MPAVAVVTVQKELFKNVAEILLEAQAAGNLISERLGKGGGGGRGRENHPVSAGLLAALLRLMKNLIPPVEDGGLHVDVQLKWHLRRP